MAESGVVTMRKLLALVEEDRRRIEGALGTRKALTALRVHDVFKTRVASSIPAVSRATGLTPPAVSSAIEALVTLDIVREVKARQRNRQFLYVGYLKTLENGTVSRPEAEPPPHDHVAGKEHATAPCGVRPKPPPSV